MSNATIKVTEADFFRIGSLLTNRESRAWGERRWLTKLETLLEQAQTIDPRHMSNELVTMNTTVVLAELESGQYHKFTLTYPEEVDLEPHGLSIFSPLGIALIGSRVGELVQCPAEQYGPMRLLRIVYQPEHDGLPR